MLVTDYTITWVTQYAATLAWTGTAYAWYTVYIDGVVSRQFYDTGSISVNVPLNSESLHTIAIIKHDSASSVIGATQPAQLNHPIIYWLGVNNAARYIIKYVDDSGTEYVIKYGTPSATVTDETMAIHYHRIAVPFRTTGVEVLRLRVYAEGSFGFCSTPAIAVGDMLVYPPRVGSLTAAADSSGDLVLSLSPA
jgi:hypothetical protein